jgi:hypothetical protein
MAQLIANIYLAKRRWPSGDRCAIWQDIREMAKIPK